MLDSNLDKSNTPNQGARAILIKNLLATTLNYFNLKLILLDSRTLYYFFNRKLYFLTLYPTNLKFSLIVGTTYNKQKGIV